MERPGRQLCQGGPVTALARLERQTRALDIALHTLDLTVAGEPVLTARNAPLGPDIGQRMYSVSKTITGLAVGILAYEERLSLDDPIVTHFPEQAPVHPWLEATTIRHILSMRGPHRATTFGAGAEHGWSWLESYFRVPPTHRPNTVFGYDTSGAYVLAALVERLAGTTLVDYLRPRLLDPLGISDGVRFLTGADGFSHGGSGLICTPRDLTRLAQLLLAGGVHRGEQLIPSDYLADATTPQASTAMQTWGGVMRGSYGYQLWLPPRGGWLMFGLGGQLVYGDPAHDLTLVVTADSQACASGDQRLLELVLTEVVDRRLAGDPAAAGRVDHEFSWPVPDHDQQHARSLSGRYTVASPGADPEQLSLELDADGGSVRSSTGWQLPFRFGAATPVRLWPEQSPAMVTAGWSGPRTLDLRCAGHGDELATIRQRLVLDDDGLTVQSQGFGETLDRRWSFHAGYLRDR